MFSHLAVVKLYHGAIPAVLAGLAAGATATPAVELYPDLRAFLIYSIFGVMAGAALGVWNSKYRGVWKFLAAVLTGAAVAGVAGPAAASHTNAAIAPLAAFLSALLAPALVLDPIAAAGQIGKTLKELRAAFGKGTGA